jgi:hypothetical protein
LKMKTNNIGEEYSKGAIETWYLVLRCLDEASKTFERIGVMEYRYSSIDQDGNKFLPLESIATLKIV